MIAALIADLVNIPVRCWLVMLGCALLLAGYAYVCWREERDER